MAQYENAIPRRIKPFMVSPGWILLVLALDELVKFLYIIVIYVV